MKNSTKCQGPSLKRTCTCGGALCIPLCILTKIGIEQREVAMLHLLIEQLPNSVYRKIFGIMISFFTLKFFKKPGCV